ncbi:Holliday junction branch migration protein RuvA [Tumebacillus permanentifrigoris]|uniref:Holliday junction branch migration complex subunit RuvA n=1 Tax=Tumebacillus permanentifrigoris TaxID=378543 RepID=A0A316D7P9_9BACL|nr:Holliday junction branch migration protein RuvA [Tumebacillus permanentifrigoris]PWK08965.1 Holliday junction DNA helicase subunit RuvA [Tumebacillus permanentifrigoris]
MISFVEGIVEYNELDHVVLNVNGIGYRVFTTGTTAYQVNQGEKLRLHTHHHVREDAILLFGFQTREERELFVRLNNVSGIGPKVAMAIIGAGAPDQVVFAIRNDDLNFLTKLPGVGKKTAQRLVLDLKDKLDDLAALFPSTPLSQTQKTPPKAKALGTELFEALLALGYNEKEAHGAVRAIAEEIEPATRLEDQIKLALKQLMRV